MTPPRPFLSGRLLASKLQAARKTAGLSLADMAGVISRMTPLAHCSTAKAGHIETGRSRIRAEELAYWSEHLRLPEAVRAELEALRAAAEERRWWATYALPRWLSDYIGYESEADTVRLFGLELVPGLVQTSEYVREIHSAAGVGTSDTRQWVVMRAGRQHRVRSGEVRLEVVLSESALRRALAVPEVGVGQVEHLLRLTEGDSASVRVLPFSRGIHASMAAGFALLDFDGFHPRVGYQEYRQSGEIVDDPGAVGEMTRIWEMLHGQALGDRESAEWLRSCLSEEERV